jgi:hypothetical protein
MAGGEFGIDGRKPSHFFQARSHKTLCSLGIAAAMDQNFKEETILIDGALPGVITLAATMGTILPNGIGESDCTRKSKDGGPATIA